MYWRESSGGRTPTKGRDALVDRGRQGSGAMSSLGTGHRMVARYRHRSCVIVPETNPCHERRRVHEGSTPPKSGSCTYSIFRKGMGQRCPPVCSPRLDSYFIRSVDRCLILPPMRRPTKHASPALRNRFSSTAMRTWEKMPLPIGIRDANQPTRTALR